ncbi:hypothetical protein AK812_SmicGene38384 [Symbiodinium microadriaticum]|uniref:Uncharacterized protein n=2 Tax=Symbiodinium TaxID=2949 RepID=A0A1Q9CDW6_SYMMI|nr:hypothetical protein AK812_SmicGene38384 [Symbiodinium microadriaticum]
MTDGSAMATAIQLDGTSMTKMKPAAEVLVDGCTSHEQAFSMQEMFVDWFPNGLKLMFKIRPRAQKLEVSVNEKTLVSKSISKLLEEDVTGLWPTDKAKIKAEIRGWLEDSPKELLQKATLRDPSVREKTGSSWFEIIGSITVILSIGVGIYTLTYLMALGLKSGPREETELLDNYEL